jgi:hypothetical protein
VKSEDIASTANARIALSNSTNAVKLLICAHYEPFPIAMRVNNQIVRPSRSIAETQPRLTPAFLRLSATISQYFNASDV